MSLALTRAFEAAERVTDTPSKISVLIDIAVLQAKSDREPAARTTLAHVFREAASVQDISKRCELLTNTTLAMLRAGAAATADWAIEEFRRLIVDRKAGDGWFGITMENFRKDKGGETSIAGPSGVYVLSVDKNGPAWQAGIEDGDVIVGMAAQQVANVAEFQKQLSSFAPGQQLAIQVVREGETKTMQVELSVRPQTRARENACLASNVDLLLQLGTFHAGQSNATSRDRSLAEAARASASLLGAERDRLLAALALTQAELGDVEAGLATTRTIKDAHGSTSALIGIAAILEQRGKKDTATTVIDEALGNAKAVDDPRNRTTALFVIAGGLTELGRLASAAEAADAMPSDERQVSAMASIGKAWAKQKDRETAARTLALALEKARKIENMNERAGALSIVAGAQTDIEPLPELLAAAVEIKEVAVQERVLKNVAMASLAMGDTKGLGDAIALLPTQEKRTAVLAEIELLRSRQEPGAGVERISKGPFKDVSSHAATALAEASSGRMDAARSSMRRAIKSIDSLLDATQKDLAWKIVVEGRVAIGDMEGARADAARIGDPSNRLWAFEEHILNAQIKQLANRRDLRRTAREMVVAVEALKGEAPPAPADTATRSLQIMSVARLLLHVGEIGEAQRVLDAIPEQPDWVRKIDGLKGVAHTQVQARSTAEAVATLTRLRAIVVASTHGARAERLREIAKLQSELGDTSGALVWSMALEAPLDRCQALLGIAETQLSAAQRAKFKKLPLVWSNLKSGGYQLRRRPADNQEVDDAIAKHTEAILKDERAAPEYAGRGQAYGLQGKYDLAIADYTKALSLQPNAVSMYVNRGGAFFHKANYDAAIADYRRAIRIDGEYEAAYFMRGRSYLAKGDVDRAISDLTQAIKLNPHYVHAFVERGLAYDKKRDYVHAIADLGAATRLDPFNAGLLDLRALMHVRAGKLLQGLADTDRALELDPENAVVYETRGRIYEALGKREEAISDFRSALSIGPGLLESVRGLKRLHATP